MFLPMQGEAARLFSDDGGIPLSVHGVAYDERETNSRMLGLPRHFPKSAPLVAAGGIEALVILVARLPFVLLQISFGSPDKQKAFDAGGCSTFHGAAVVAEAPSHAAALGASSANALAIKVDRDGGPIRGAVARAA
jgi:hypothetical protein